MEWIDDEGRLFGVINVVDALVVLFVIAIAIAGMALLLDEGTDTEPEPTKFATVEYTLPPGTTASPVVVNDTLESRNGGDTFAIRDTVYGFTSDGSVRVVASVAYTGTPQVGNSEAAIGRSYGMTSGTDDVRVRFLTLNRSSPDLETRQLSVVLAINESRQVSHVLEPGTTVTIGDQTVARLVSIDENPDGIESRTELLGVELQVWNDGTTNWFGGQAVRVNNRLTVVTDEVVVTGRVYRVGTTRTDE